MFKFKPSKEWLQLADKAERGAEISAGITSKKTFVDPQFNELVRKVESDPDACLKTFLIQAKSIGVTRDFLIKRIDIDNFLRDYPKRVSDKEGSSQGVINLAIRTSTAFGVDTPSLLFGGAIHERPVLGARFKKRKNTEERFLNSYTSYAYNLTRILIKAVDAPKARSVSGDYKAFRELFLGKFGEFSLENIVQFTWQLGIPILPLRDSGAFNGACWTVNGQRVIVLKQTTDFEGRWIHDLLHELFHISKNQDQENFAVLDEVDNDEGTDEEEAANGFAADVILDGKAEDLVAECVKRARGSVERLKSVVPAVAKDRHADLAALTYYMAYRLALQKINWWGTVSNLDNRGSPFEKVKGACIERLNWDRLNNEERTLLTKALD